MHPLSLGHEESPAQCDVEEGDDTKENGIRDRDLALPPVGGGGALQLEDALVLQDCAYRHAHTREPRGEACAPGLIRDAYAHTG